MAWFGATAALEDLGKPEKGPQAGTPEPTPVLPEMPLSVESSLGGKIWQSLPHFCPCSQPAQMARWKARVQLPSEIRGQGNPPEQPHSSPVPPTEGGAKLEKLRSEAKNHSSSPLPQLSGSLAPPLLSSRVLSGWVRHRLKIMLRCP